MAAPPLSILVPEASARELAGAASRLEVVTYREGAVTLMDRVLRKAGLRPPDALAHRKVHLADPGAARRVRAWWVGPQVDLSAAEADALLSGMPALEWVFWQRTGLDAVPLEVFQRHGVSVAGAGDLTSDWVAETNLACIVADAKHLTASARQRPRQPLPYTRPLRSLTVAVVGTGRIGSATASLCREVGMRVVGISREPERVAADHPFHELRPLRPGLAGGLEGVDYLVLAVPLVHETRHLVGDEALEALGPRGVVVNLARPRVVDQMALLRHLRQGRLRAAYVSRLDDPLSPLARWRAQRLPHLFFTHNLEARTRAKSAAAAALFLEGLRERGLLD